MELDEIHVPVPCQEDNKRGLRPHGVLHCCASVCSPATRSRRQPPLFTADVQLHCQPDTAGVSVLRVGAGLCSRVQPAAAATTASRRYRAALHSKPTTGACWLCSLCVQAVLQRGKCSPQAWLPQVFWRAILAYTEMVLVCKLLFQLPAFCMCNNSYSL